MTSDPVARGNVNQRQTMRARRVLIHICLASGASIETTGLDGVHLVEIGDFFRDDTVDDHTLQAVMRGRRGSYGML